MNYLHTYHTLFRITTLSEQVRALRLPWRTLRLKKEPHWQKDMTRHDLKADLAYLRAADQYRAIGVLTNRTWNYLTSGYPCGDLFNENVYNNYSYVPNDGGWNKLKVRGMKTKKYDIYYYDANNPSTPLPVGNTDHQTEWGPELNLEYPDLTSSIPFILFKLVVHNNSLPPQFAPNNTNVLARQEISRDSLVKQKGSVHNTKVEVTQDLEQEGAVTLYPNPASQKVTIKIPDDENNYSLTVLNNSSQVLMTGITLHKTLNSIDISRLSQGLYQVVITDEDKITHFKLVVE